MSFHASYPGTCTDCGARFAPGDLIERDTNGTGEHLGYVHAACPDDPSEAVDRAAMTLPRCPRCSTNHPGSC